MLGRAGARAGSGSAWIRRPSRCRRGGAMSMKLLHDVLPAPPLRAGWFEQLRDRARRVFLESGLPSTTREEWKYTSLSALAATEFALPAPIGEAAALEDAAGFGL